MKDPDGGKPGSDLRDKSKSGSEKQDPTLLSATVDSLSMFKEKIIVGYAADMSGKKSFPIGGI